MLKNIITTLDAKIQTENQTKQVGKMYHIKAYYQILHDVINLNGFKWFGYCEDSTGNYFHHFQKQIGKKWIEIKATDDDITNGNIVFMTENMISNK